MPISMVGNSYSSIMLRSLVNFLSHTKLTRNRNTIGILIRCISLICASQTSLPPRLFQLGSSYEWDVTKKAGRSSESDMLAMEERETKAMNHQKLVRGTSDGGLSELNKLREQEAAPKSPAKKMNKIFKRELTLAFLLLTAAVRSLLSAQGVHFYFLLFQGVTFLLVGLDRIVEQMS